MEVSIEGQKIYEESYKELSKLKKKISQDQLTIDFAKLDSKTSGLLRTTITNAISERSRDIYSVISKVN